MRVPGRLQNAQAMAGFGPRQALALPGAHYRGASARMAARR
jgi:hypothetical protein